MIANEQMAHEDAPTGRRKGRADRYHACAEIGGEGFGDRADIAVIRGVEGRADLVDDLFRPLRAQPAKCATGLRDGGRHRGRAGLQGDHTRLDGWIGSLSRKPRPEHGPHALACQRIGDVGRAGEVVADHSEFHGRNPAR